MKRIYLLLLVTVNFIPCFSQVSNQWNVYYAGSSEAAGFFDDGTYIWVGTNRNLIRLEKSSGTQQFFELPEELKFCGFDSYISDIKKDHVGNLWIGTFIGLYKFDGATFTAYNPVNALTSVLFIINIKLDSNEHLWMSTNGAGLVEFDGTNWNIFDTSTSAIPINDLNHFAIDNSNNKWIATYGFGILKFDGTTWTIYDTSNTPMTIPYAYQIAADSNGGIWASKGTFCDTEILNYNGTTWQYIPYNIPLCFSPSSIFFGNSGNTYVADLFAGLLKYNGTTWSLDTSFVSITNNYYLPYASMDSTGDIWACGYNTSNNSPYILKFDGSAWQGFQIVVLNSGLISSWLWPLLVDDNNNLWIGSTSWNQSGLNKFDGTTWSSFVTPGGINQPVYSLGKDTGNVIWVGASMGDLYTFDGANWAKKDTIGNPSGVFLNENISAIIVDTNHHVWVTTGVLNTSGFTPGRGLYEFDGTGWTLHLNGFSPHAGTCLAIDSLGNKWMGTIGNGLAKFNGSTWTTYSTFNSGIPGDTVRCVTIDSAGSIWVGTLNGFAVFDGINWTAYDSLNTPLPSNNVRYITFDQQGLAYIACNGGLVTFDGSTWTVYDMNNSPLSNSNLRFVAIDQQCNVWITTSCGLNEIIGNCATGIEENTSSNQLSIFPNPSSSEFQISNYQFQPKDEIRLTDVSGRILFTKTIAEKCSMFNVQCSTLANGIYFVEIISGKEKIIKKLVKQ